MMQRFLAIKLLTQLILGFFLNYDHYEKAWCWYRSTYKVDESRTYVRKETIIFLLLTDNCETHESKILEHHLPKGLICFRECSFEDYKADRGEDFSINSRKSLSKSISHLFQQ